ncbi:adenine phosphoribosyltransferase [Gilvimarinus agarilyticus]|uniref:adenine phosphoribosyltransferase n=1 Tax=Gilvimarinus agarilyticus TaxID=679259 RepID=UPI0005A03A42|nr:adenine phosphoribosyltransferase [Gilvimarinus agarilyticus]
MKIDRLKASITTVSGYPKPGIEFRDITSLLLEAEALRECVLRMAAPLRGQPIDKIVAIEARGFIFGAALAMELGCGLVLARKPGKLPRATRKASYVLEYGEDSLHIHTDAIREGERVLLVDDLIATGGTADAVVSLVDAFAATLCGAVFAVALEDLPGMARLRERGIAVHYVMSFKGG